MKEERIRMLCEKFKDRKLLTELDFCSEYPKQGFMTRADADFYEWLCYSAYTRIKDLEEELDRARYHARYGKKLTDIYVRDKYSGRIHRVGDDRHDSLSVDEEGTLCYDNMQNGDGTPAYKSADREISKDGRSFSYGYEFLPSECGELDTERICRHCLGISFNAIGEMIGFCEECDEGRNITLGACIGNCEGEEPLLKDGEVDVFREALEALENASLLQEKEEGK